MAQIQPTISRPRPQRQTKGIRRYRNRDRPGQGDQESQTEQVMDNLTEEEREYLEMENYMNTATESELLAACAENEDLWG